MNESVTHLSGDNSPSNPIEGLQELVDIFKDWDLKRKELKKKKLLINKVKDIVWNKSIVGRHVSFPQKNGKLVWGVEVGRW